MVTRFRSSMLVAALLTLFARSALAQEPRANAAEPNQAPKAEAASAPAQAAPASGSPAPVRPRLLHAPVSVATAHERVLIYADIVDPELLKRAYVVYEAADARRQASVELQRAPQIAGYVAEIPAKDVRTPAVLYTIEFELTDGTRVSAFASRSEMQRVAVAEDYLDLRERALLERLHGRRSVVSAEGEYVSFGDSIASVYSPSGTTFEPVPDRYYRAEVTYTYRPLRLITEFSARIGALRGQAPAPGAVTVRGREALDVGLDYVAPSVRLRLVDACHVDLEFLSGLTEEKFRVGALSRLLIGDPYGSKLVLGMQGVQGFGARFWTRVDITATDRVMVSPIIEATNWPHADAYGVRLLLELAVEVGSGVTVVAGSGYQARQATSGGPSASLALRASF